MGTNETQPSVMFWQRKLADLMAGLEASPSGLTAAEAERRRARFGVNLLVETKRLGLIRRLVLRFRNPLVLVLLGAAFISALTGDVASFVIISAIVLLGTGLDALQEYRAENAADELKKKVALKERVLRDGVEVDLAAEALVPGDIVLLSAGDMVPADGRIVEAKNLLVNEAVLTGESYPAEKRVADDIAGAGLADADNAVFMGSSVVGGSARILVCATGLRTQIGSIADTLRRPAPPAALERGTYEFGILIVRLTTLLTLFVLLMAIVFGRPILESFLFAVALAVGLTPELLPMVVSVTLARGALRMAKQKVIVKRLAAIHDLGAMDILCTDKTGTLTEARIRLAKCVSVSGSENPRVLTLAWLNSHFQGAIKNPLEMAILEAEVTGTEGWTKIDELPFDFERRRVSVLLARGDERLIVVKGAPEDIIGISANFEDGPEGAVRPFDGAARASAMKLFEQLGEEGLRVLAVAVKKVAPAQPVISLEDETEVTLSGFAAFLDPPKASAGVAIADLERDGVGIKIVTGDNEKVTLHLCGELGITVSGILTGAQIQALNDDALAARVEETTVFCRATPAQKNRVIRALKRRGHVVGYMGDGINDAPSLHAADVGISVDGAVDVARDAADMIMLENDLGVLQRGVLEGRRTFGNIMKYVMMGTSSNFGNMFSMAGASIILPFLPMLPIQILLNNLLYDVSEIAIPMDEVDEEQVAHPRHWNMAFIRNFMLVLGPVSSLFDFLTFGILLHVFKASETLFHTGWFVESLATQVLVIFVIRTRRNPLASRPHPALTATSLGVVLLAIVFPYTPAGAWFGFVPLPASFLAVLAAMTVAYLVLAEFVKRRFYRHYATA